MIEREHQKNDPRLQIQRVVIPGVGARTIVVGPRSVESVIDRVLERQLDVAPGPKFRAATLVPWEIVGLKHNPIALWRS